MAGDLTEQVAIEILSASNAVGVFVADLAGAFYQTEAVKARGNGSKPAINPKKSDKIPPAAQICGLFAFCVLRNALFDLGQEVKYTHKW